MFYRTLITSVLGIVLCTACLAGSTWAWFSVSITSSENVLTAANFSGTVEITADGETIAVSTEGCSHVAALAAGREYNIILTAEGQAAGYARVTSGEENHYTPPLFDGGVFRFTIIPEEDTTIRICFIWGTYSGEPDILDGGTLQL